MRDRERERHTHTHKNTRRYNKITIPDFLYPRDQQYHPGMQIYSKDRELPITSRTVAFYTLHMLSLPRTPDYSQAEPSQPQPQPQTTTTTTNSHSRSHRQPKPTANIHLSDHCRFQIHNSASIYIHTSMLVVIPFSIFHLHQQTQVSL